MTAPLTGRRVSVDHSAAGAIPLRPAATLLSLQAANFCPPRFLWPAVNRDDPVHQAILVPKTGDSDV